MKLSSRISTLLFLSLLISLASSCNVNKQTSKYGTAVTEIPVREHSVQSVLWQQRSAEYDALCYQAYNMATLYLDNYLDEHPDAKNLAIVTDIDETVMDNSPYNAKMIETDTEYSREGWIDWGKQKQAKEVPGAKAFFNHASNRGVQIFYISNRYDVQLPETMDNLRSLGFPQVETDHVLLRTTTSEKEARRSQVSKDHNIIMLLGDNLSDFTHLFDKKGTAERGQIASDLRNQFGTRFIVFPNPMYGDWETKGIYEGKYDWTPAQKDSLRKKKIISY